MGQVEGSRVLDTSLSRTPPKIELRVTSSERKGFMEGTNKEPHGVWSV